MPCKEMVESLFHVSDVLLKTELRLDKLVRYSDVVKGIQEDRKQDAASRSADVSCDAKSGLLSFL